MGTKVEIKSRFPGYFSMRDLNEDSDSCGWPLLYGDRTFTNGQCYKAFWPRNAVDVYSGYDKDEVKRTMLEHEAIFKSQVCELHRLYRTQRDLMNEARMTELNKNHVSLSSSPLASSQITSRKWHIHLGNEDMHSPLSSTKGSGIQASPLISQKAGTSKDTAVLESRPSKVRRKMFDLHLPADKYIDTEQVMDENVCANSSYHGNVLGAESCMKGKSNLADLNDPLEVDDTEIEQLELGAKPKSDTNNGALHDSYLRNHVKSWFPHMLDSGHNKNSLLYLAQDIQPQNMPSSSENAQLMLGKNKESATHFVTNQSKEDRWSKGTIHGSQLKTWSHTVSSWEKLNGSFDHKSMPVQAHSSATLSRSSRSSTQSHCIFVNRRNYNANSTSNLTTQSDLPHKNGFYRGSEELLLRFASGNYDSSKCSGAGNAAHEHFIDQNSAKLYNNSNCTELKASQKYSEVIDLERNHEDDVVTLPWLRTKPNCKIESSSYPGFDLNADINSLNLSSDSNEGGNGKVPNQLILQNPKSASCANGADDRTIGGIDSSSIFEKPRSSKIESFHPQPSKGEEYDRININLPCDHDVAETQVMPLEKQTRIQIDLNSCITEDEACLTPSVTGSNVKTLSGIDLEAPAVPEEEDDMVPRQECTERPNTESLPQPTQEKDGSLPDECIKTAAEAIVAISLSGKDVQRDDDKDPLQWFVELVSSFGEDNDTFRINDGYSSEDYFESMTLRLSETKEEDYMPKPLVPETLILPEASTSLVTTRTRRGNARRGRQRRDFQRDILPGLASLTRHEVTEDLQTFGGIMRATGHSWNSGLTRRNGCGRGRRRSLINASPPPPPPPPPPILIEQLSNVEVGLEDRNLTGWGKTTRRPRRQRCPPGNPPALPVSERV